MQSLSLYDGRVQLFFDPGPHKYYVEIDGGERKQVDSATQVLNIINKPALLPWAVKMTVEWLKEKWEPGRAYDEIEIESLLKESKSARFKKSGRALSIGSLVHDWMEDCVNLLIDEKMVLVTDPETKEMVSLLCQSDDDDPEVIEMTLPFNEEAQNGVRAFISWNEEHSVEWLASEKKTYSIDGNYSGTLDGDAIVDGKRTMVDFKTSKRIYDEYWLQCACYVHAQEEEARFVGEIEEEENLFEQIVILRVPKDKAEFEAQSETNRDVIDNWIDVFFALPKANELKNGK